MKNDVVETSTPLFSADSHVIEDLDFWDGILPTGHFSPGERGSQFACDGHVDPVARIADLARDGVSGEILYPSLGLKLFGLEDAELQERCFRRYNDWLAEFCAVSPTHLFGIGLISCYRIDNAVAELERCANAGLRGVEIWQAPHPDLPFDSDHYERLWDAAATSHMPVSLHILTGPEAGQGRRVNAGPATTVSGGIEMNRASINVRLLNVQDAILKIMFSGTFERHPDLKIVLVETEIGWLPFIFDQFDRYAEVFRDARPHAMLRPPSQYFGQQLFSTFFRDPVGMKLLDWWGQDGCMWSNDYPHQNSTWPHSKEIIDQNLGYLSSAVREKLVRTNAHRLYRIDG